MHSKRDIRSLMLERREALDQNEMARATQMVSKQLTAFQGKVIGAHLPIRGEIDAWSIAKKLSFHLCLPSIETEDRVLTFRSYKDGDRLIQGKHNILCPPPDAPLCIPQILFIPLLAFDRLGHRLGYGGGYYDTTIAALKRSNPELQAIGLAYDFQHIDRIPTEAHDARLDAIITPSAYIIPQS